MKIRSAVPENGCLVFFGERKKTEKNICKTYTHPPHPRLRKQRLYRILLFQFWLYLHLAGFKNSGWIWGELVFGSQNNTPDETNGINNAVSCYKETIQFSASFVM